MKFYVALIVFFTLVCTMVASTQTFAKQKRLGATQDFPDKSNQYISKSGESVEDLNHKGWVLYKQKLYTEAVFYFKRAAELGYDIAQCSLGYCYNKGLGVAVDYEEAVKWYRKSAEQGNADAQCSLGYCYEKGHGVAVD